MAETPIVKRIPPKKLQPSNFLPILLDVFATSSFKDVVSIVKDFLHTYLVYGFTSLNQIPTYLGSKDVH